MSVTSAQALTEGATAVEASSATVMTPVDARPRRRRNRALAAQRRTRAIELATQGRTYQQIADELGYANRGTVHHIVHGALAKQEASAAQQLRHLQDDRLNALLRGIWARAMNGDLAAVNAAARIILSQCRLYGLLDEKTVKGAEKQLKTVVLTQGELDEMGLTLPSVALH